LIKQLPATVVAPSKASRGGLRTVRLHRGAPVRPETDHGAGRKRRVPRWNAIGIAAVAAAVAALGVFGGLVIAHGQHPKTSLASDRSRLGSHSSPGPTSRPGGRHSGTARRGAGRSRPHHARGGTQGNSTGPPATNSAPHTSPQVLPPVECPGKALLGVYAPGRLDLLATCDWVLGRVTSVAVQDDGNRRVTLVGTDARRVVLEVILGQHLPAPRVGERVAAFGTLVRDRAAGWTGLEPVWAIDYLDRGTLVRAVPPAVPVFHAGEVCVPTTPPVCTPVPTPTLSVPAPSLPAVP